MITPEAQNLDDWDTASTTGNLLRGAREARGWSVQHVAKQLRLDSKHVEAMENDAMTPLLAPVFVRGYLRSYARLLDLSPEAVEKSFESQKTNVPQVLRGRSVLTSVDSHHGDRALSWIIYLIVLASLLLGVVWWQTEGTFRFWEDEPAVVGAESDLPIDPATDNSLEQAPPFESSSTVGAGVTPQARGAGSTVPPAISPVPQPALPAQAQTRVTPVTPSAPAPPSVQPTAPALPAATPVAAPTVAGSAPSLELRVSADSWVEIIDPDGKRLIYQILKAGTNRNLTDIKPPLKVKLGNAAGVTMDFNGQPFDHSSFQRNGVARFELGAAP